MQDTPTKEFAISEISEKLLNLIPDLVLVKGPRSHILWANKAFQEYYGMTNEVLQGMIDAPTSNPNDTVQYIKDDAYVFNTGKTLEILEEQVTRHDGSVGYFHTIKSAIHDDYRNVTMTIGVSREVTERKKAAEEMKVAMDNLEKLNNFMIDREVKMSELKMEITELKKQLPLPT